MTETRFGPENPDLDVTSLAPDRLARFLDALLAALGTAASPADFASLACQASVEALGTCCAICLPDPTTGELKLAGLHHRCAEQALPARRLFEGWLKPTGSLLHRALSGNRPLARSLGSQEQAREVFGTRERARLARSAGLTSFRLAPLLFEHRRLGLIVLASGDPLLARDDQSLTLTAVIARRVSLALVHLQRLDRARLVSQQLALTSLRLQTILESLPQGVVVADAPEGRVVSASRSLVRILGRGVDLEAPVSEYPERFGLFRPDGERCRPEDLPWVRSARTGQPTDSEELAIQRPDGRSVTVLCSASPMLDEHDRPAGAVAILQDISERKQLEREKDEFLAIAAHELRTPLTTLKGFVQLLLRWADREPPTPLGKGEVTKMLEHVDKQATRLSRLVTDLLDLSRIKEGRLQLNRSRLSVGTLARDVVARMQTYAPDRQFGIAIDGDTTVEADASHLEQVLANVLANAIKATSPGGRITVRVRREQDSVVAAVQDDGVGMSADVQRHVFDRLFRGPERQHEGMGLGLYICRGIVEAHGGRVWMESELGRGSTFYFSLPAASA